jgi:hypothetical protein
MLLTKSAVFGLPGQAHFRLRNRCLPAATPLLTVFPEKHFLHVGIVPSPFFLMGISCRKYIF